MLESARMMAARSLLLFIVFLSIANPAEALEFEDALGWGSEAIGYIEEVTGNNPVVRGAAIIGSNLASGIDLVKYAGNSVIRGNKGVSRLTILSGTIAKFVPMFVMRAGISSVASLAAPVCMSNPFFAIGCGAAVILANAGAAYLSNYYQESAEGFVSSWEKTLKCGSMAWYQSIGDTECQDKEPSPSFGSASNSRQPTQVDTAKMEPAGKSEVERWKLAAFRTTSAEGVEELGIPPEMAEAAQCNPMPGDVQEYARFAADEFMQFVSEDGSQCWEGAFEAISGTQYHYEIYCKGQLTSELYDFRVTRKNSELMVQQTILSSADQKTFFKSFADSIYIKCENRSQSCTSAKQNWIGNEIGIPYYLCD